jgi:hypothetical protein
MRAAKRICGALITARMYPRPTGTINHSEYMPAPVVNGADVCRQKDMRSIDNGADVSAPYGNKTASSTSLTVSIPFATIFHPDSPPKSKQGKSNMNITETNC